MKLRLLLSSIFAFSILITSGYAQSDAFHPGPVFADIGAIASVDVDQQISKNEKFYVRFDVSKQSKSGTVSGTLQSAARYVNLHIEAGVPRENIKVAIVVHGTASLDMTNDEFYMSKNDGAQNPNIKAINDLTQYGVEIYICGQSATYRGITKADLLPNVKMALSALTAHSILQQKGYALNPF